MIKTLFLQYQKKNAMGYTNYDSWKTENPWDGQARLLGYKDEEDMIRHQEEQAEDEEN